MTLRNTKTDKDFTVLESLFIEALVKLLYAEEGYTDVDINDICDTTGRKTRSMRGVLSSLIKKGVVSMHEHEGFDFVTRKVKRFGRTITTRVEIKKMIQLILLNEDFYYLHPEWSVENI